MNIYIGDNILKIDEEDLDLYQSRKWHISDSGYLVWRGIEDGKKKTIRFHRLVNNTPDGLVTDHINHDRLDNRRSNLRAVTQSENMRNKKEQGKGYWFQKKNNNWVVEVNGSHIGCFETEQEAQEVVKFVRAGGEYKKPERTHCKKGHSLADAYKYGKTKICRVCQSERSRRYYVKTTERIKGRRPSDRDVAKNNANALWRRY